MKRTRRFFILIASFIWILSSEGAAQTAESAPSLQLNFGFPKTVLPDLNERDAKAAIKVWTEDVIEKRHYHYRTAFFLYDDVRTLIEAMKNGRVNIAPLSPVDYLRLRKTFFLYPAVLARVNETLMDRFVLLAHRNGPYTDVRDLAGRSLLLKQDSPNSVLSVWLEVMLHERGLSGSERFFGSITRKEREMQLIFPLLLKQADCCVIPQSAFDTMCELNPQISEQLVALITSEPYYASNIFCYTDQLDEETRNRVTSFALNWEKSKATEQLQTLFRFNQLIPYDSEYLVNIELLLERYDRIEKEDAETRR